MRQRLPKPRSPKLPALLVEFSPNFLKEVGDFLDLNSKMIVHTAVFSIKTQGQGTYEITDAVTDIVRASGVQAGTVTIFVQHTSASLVIYENADQSARVDLHAFFQRLCPEDDDSFTHRSEGPDDMPAHLRTILTRTSEVIPIFGGQVQTGTWQGVFLFEHRRAPQVRKVVISVIGIC